MKFDFRCLQHLPRLAWCARLRRGLETVLVIHGPWVETDSDLFLEGAWNGSFGEGSFQEATTFMGSGGRIARNSVLFSTPTHPYEGLFSTRADSELVVSNSLTFLFAQIDDRPDPGYAGYFFDFLRSFRMGIGPPARSLPTVRGRRIMLHDCVDLQVETDLSIRPLSKKACVPPRCFDDYLPQIQESLARLVQNAADSRRKQVYRPVVAVGRGYDSPAVAVLAVHAGCREAVTVSREEDGAPDSDDDGTLLAESLGLKTTGYARYAYRRLPGTPEAEFCAVAGLAGRVPMKVMEPQLAGSLLLTGDHGDVVWGMDAGRCLPGWQDIRSFFGRGSLNEFRLRAGFLYSPVPTISAANSPAIHQISVSKEMQPWSLPSRYNRPIPRRIVEEAGVPRSWFGMKRGASSHSRLTSVADLSPEARRDFLAFCAAQSVPLPSSSSGNNPGLARKAQAYTARRLYGGLCRLPLPLLVPLLPVLRLKLWDRGHWLWASPLRYAFHWGVERTLQRYRSE